MQPDSSDRRTEPYVALNDIIQGLRQARYEKSEQRSMEVASLGAELKQDIKKIEKQEWFQNFCKLLKETELLVVCSRPFTNQGYPTEGECFLVATGSGLRVGYKELKIPFTTEPRDFSWPEIRSGEMIPSAYTLQADWPCEHLAGTQLIRHRAPSSLAGFRQFDFQYAAAAGVTFGEVEENLIKALAKCHNSVKGQNTE